eukprot:scaffold98082_cov37-Tisochrysis_lutea.AAC.5
METRESIAFQWRKGPTRVFAAEAPFTATAGTPMPTRGQDIRMWGEHVSRRVKGAWLASVK